MKEINVISWGGGTQSTALMLMALNGEYNIKKPDYIILSDTGDENEMVYSQIFKVSKYVKDTYGVDIIITKKNKIKLDLPSMETLIVKGGLGEKKQFKTSPYADLYQEQVLFYKGIIDQANLVPSWVINKDGNIGKMMGRQCTVEYKITQIIREIREREGLKRFNHKQHKINMYIGFSVDEMYRLKPSITPYINNVYPLYEAGLSKIDCIAYVERELGFKPKSSVCNMCYANRFDTIYDIYKNDKVSWEKLLVLDYAMEHKNQPKIRADEVYMFQWQAHMRKRLHNIDMDAEYKRRHQYTQLSIYDVLEQEEQMACMGGCFL